MKKKLYLIFKSQAFWLRKMEAITEEAFNLEL